MFALKVLALCIGFPLTVVLTFMVFDESYLMPTWKRLPVWLSVLVVVIAVGLCAADVFLEWAHSVLRLVHLVE